MMYTRNYLDLQPRPELFTPTKHAVAVAATTPVRLAKGPILDEIAAAGNVALWTVTVLMGVSSLVFYTLAARVSLQKRLLHFLVSLITTVSFLAYFAMATGSGTTFILLSSRSSSHSQSDALGRNGSGSGSDTTRDTFRQVHWARYVAWSLTTPLALSSLALISSLPGLHLLTGIAGGAVWVLGATVGALAAGDAHAGGQRHKWLWYVVATVGYLVVVWQVGVKGKQALRGKDSKITKFFGVIATFWLGLVVVYHIVWAVSNNAHKLSVNSEVVFYSVLDVLSQGMFGYWLLAYYNALPEMVPNIEGFWSHGFGSEGNIRLGENGNV